MELKKISRRSFLKAGAFTTAAAVLGVPAFADAPEEETNGSVGTTVSRKSAAAGLTEGKMFDYDAENPYLNVNVGLFHNVPITVNESTTGIATYYLPDGMDPWAPAAIIMTPDNMTAKEFSGSACGIQWRMVAAQNKIGLAFVEPKDGGTWNLTLDPAKRDDAALLDGLYQLMRKKSTSLTGAFSMDKSHTALVGYKEGGAAALLFGARWASDFSSICAVDATSVPALSLEAVGEKYVLPFPGDTTRGIEEEAIAAKTVDTPVWFVRCDTGWTNSNALKFYLDANKATVAQGNEKAQQVYASGRAGSAAEVWVSDNYHSPADIWKSFSGQYKRFMAIQLPGRIAKAEQFARSGFDIHEEIVNGELRRWMIYTPSSYTGKEAVPMVLVMHGYTASMYAIAEESRWYDVAEQNGFIVVFAQGLVRPASMMGNIPTAMWLAGPFSMLAGEGTDPDVDLNFIESLLDRMEADYNVDAGRIYATGHSNGSLMTWAVGMRFTNRIAAIAPVGYMYTPTDEIDAEVLLPTWSFLGEYDSAGVAQLVAGNATVTSLQGWNKHNATDEQAVAENSTNEGAFATKTFSNAAGVPLVKYTVVKDTPHVYLQEESTAIWNDFFAKYQRGKDGALYYKETEDSALVAVTAGEYRPSDKWYNA